MFSAAGTVVKFSGVAGFVKASIKDSSFRMHFYVRAPRAACRMLTRCLSPSVAAANLNVSPTATLNLLDFELPNPNLRRAGEGMLLNQEQQTFNHLVCGDKVEVLVSSTVAEGL